ncbi:MAG: N-glycosylase/DNA lyase [Candidatus Bathyarchaeia archaeon]
MILDGLNDLVSLVRKLEDSEVKDLVNARIKEFKENRYKPINEIFKELCFCILTANFSAEKTLRIQMEIDEGFINLSERDLADKLRVLGHRHPDLRAKYIVEARKIIHQLERTLRSQVEERSLREWLVKNVKGLGYKEASHFLRNIGFMNLAIIDFHIINLLSKYGLINKPKTLTKRKYMEIERILSKISLETGLSLGELDLYLWFIETGKVLK